MSRVSHVQRENRAFHLNQECGNLSLQFVDSCDAGISEAFQATDLGGRKPLQATEEGNGEACASKETHHLRINNCIFPASLPWRDCHYNKTSSSARRCLFSWTCARF